MDYTLSSVNLQPALDFLERTVPAYAEKQRIYVDFLFNQMVEHTDTPLSYSQDTDRELIFITALDPTDHRHGVSRSYIYQEFTRYETPEALAESIRTIVGKALFTLAMQKEGVISPAGLSMVWKLRNRVQELHKGNTSPMLTSGEAQVIFQGARDKLLALVGKGSATPVAAMSLAVMEHAILYTETQPSMPPALSGRGLEEALELAHVVLAPDFKLSRTSINLKAAGKLLR